MNAREQGFLLLTSSLGDPQRKPLTAAQFRELAIRMHAVDAPIQDRDMTVSDLTALGYRPEAARRILSLLEQQELLEYYVHKGIRQGCQPITRISEDYPLRARKALGEDSPGTLWAMGDLSLLKFPCVSLVGSRDLNQENKNFAAEVGRQAARQGYVLVSGNARGADRTAQQACLDAGGRVICVVADALYRHSPKENILYLSEDGFDLGFSSQRAHSRNRVIHSLSPVVLVAQSGLTGGTWKGTQKNLRQGWSRVCCYDDGSEASRIFAASGAVLISPADLQNLASLNTPSNLFDSQER